MPQPYTSLCAKLELSKRGVKAKHLYPAVWRYLNTTRAESRFEQFQQLIVENLPWTCPGLFLLSRLVAFSRV